MQMQTQDSSIPTAQKQRGPARPLRVHEYAVSIYPLLWRPLPTAPNSVRHQIVVLQEARPQAPQSALTFALRTLLLF